MSPNCFTMWGMLFLMAFGGALAGPLIHGNVFGAIRAAFPADRATSDALHRRGQIDAEFSRCSAPDRAVCAGVIFRATAQVSANPVD